MPKCTVPNCCNDVEGDAFFCVDCSLMMTRAELSLLVRTRLAASRRRGTEDGDHLEQQLAGYKKSIARRIAGVMAA